MKTITSLQNESIKHAVKLQESGYRKAQGQFVAQGYTTCITLIKAGYQPIAQYLTHPFYLRHADEFDVENIIIVPNHIIDKISTVNTPSGIVVVFAIPKATFTPTSNALVLYNIQDPGNMGTIIRSAAAMNIENIFSVGGCDPYSPKVIQATVGTIALANIVQIDWNSFLTQHAHLKTCALVVDGGQAPKEINLSESILVVGNEGQGLPEDVITVCNQKLTIPMPGKTESLNAAVAGSIALYLKTISN